MGADTTRVLVHLFKVAGAREERDVGIMAQGLSMERGVLQYHLDQLRERRMATMTSGNYRFGHVYCSAWARRTRPSTSAATSTNSLCGPPFPPTSASSICTKGPSGSRSGRTSAARSLCSHLQAVL